MSNSLKLFRRISWAEGISFLVLLFIAMPLKYGLGFALAVKIVGWAHGVLFILYFAFGLQAAKAEGWGMRTMGVAVVSSVIPLGPFILDRHLSLNKSVV
jgi:integral membrane protein